MTRRITTSLLALVFLMGIIGIIGGGCTKEEDLPERGTGAGTTTGGGTDDAGAAPESDEEYVMIGISTGVEYWNANKQGLDDICERLGVKGTFTGPQEQNAEMQAAELDRAIARKPAGILIAPGSPETLIPYINRAMDEGIPVITVDTDAPESNRIAYFGTENYEAGRMGARILGDTLRDKAGLDGPGEDGQFKVAISSRPGQWNLDERVRGYEEEFEENYPDVTIVAVIDDETKYTVGEREAGAIISKYPDLAGFAGVNAASGPGIAAAVEAAGKVGQIPIVAMDGDTAVLEKIESGSITASVAQRQYYMTYLGIQYLYGLNHGYCRAPGDEAAEGELPEIPEIIDTGTVEVNADNVDAFDSPSQGAAEELVEKHPDWVDIFSIFGASGSAEAFDATTSGGT